MLTKKYFIITLLLTSFLFSCSKKEKKETIKIAKQTQKIDKLPYFNTPDFNPMWLTGNNNLEEFHKIPEFSFKNQLNEEVTNKTFEGKIYVANFFFTTCPNICIQLTQNMRQIQQLYANDNDVKLLSHTVLPSIDTVEILKEYGERQNIDPKKWHLVTGDKEKIYELARKAYFADDLYKQTKDKNRFIHTENLILIDKKGHIRGVYKGTLPAEVKRIQRHIEILKKE